jgi:hypothetical protein
MGIVELLWLTVRLPGQGIFDLFCVLEVALRYAHLVSQNEEHTVSCHCSPQQIQSEVVPHGLPDPSALMPVADRHGASAQGIPRRLQRLSMNPLCTQESIGGWMTGNKNTKWAR